MKIIIGFHTDNTVPIDIKRYDSVKSAIDDLKEPYDQGENFYIDEEGHENLIVIGEDESTSYIIVLDS